MKTIRKFLFLIALLTLAGRTSRQLHGKTVGVIGVGNVGSRVADKARALGMNVLRNDPPLARRSPRSSRSRPRSPV